MTSISRKMIKQLKSKLLTQSLVTQSLMDLLIEKEIFTRDEIMNKLDANIELYQDFIDENKTLSDDIETILESISEETDNKEELFSGLYYGPAGDC
jgi:cell division septum initiation protein DivIVA